MSNKLEKIDGMPKIADMARSKKSIIVAILVIVMIGMGVMFFTFKSNQKEEVRKDDIYHVDEATLSGGNAPVINGAPSADVKPEVQNNQQAMNVNVASLIAKQKELEQRLTAPLMVVNSNSGAKVVDAPNDKALRDTNPNMQFLEQVSGREVKSENAELIGSLNAIIAEGSFIHAILESATNSDLPGYLRAVVSEPVYSEDGSNVLIPQGSRLIGEYKSGMLQGQSRIFIVWSRVITPQGLSVQLGSTGIDSLGVSGMGADMINRHFWERFGMASLLSVIGTGAANAGVSGNDQSNSASTYRSALANSFAQSAGDSLQQDGAIAPTLKTYQGKPIMVFVAKDLQFGEAIKKTTPSVNVF